MSGGLPRVGGTGPWPGQDLLEAQRAVVDDLTDLPTGVQGLPYAVHLPEDGWSDAVAQAVALLQDLPVELGPHGWRLTTGRPGADLRRARAADRERLDALAVAAHGYAGPLTLPVLGPWTLAATLYLARGDRVLSDRSAVADAAESLAAGLAEQLRAVRTQVPGADLRVVLVEPLLAQVSAGVLPSFSGYARLPAVPRGEVVERLQRVVDGLAGETAQDGGVPAVVHVGQGWGGVEAVAGMRGAGVGVDLGPWNERGWERLAALAEDGTDLWLGLAPPAVSQCAGVDLLGLARQLTVPWRRIGLTVEHLGRVVLTPRHAPSIADPLEARAMSRALGRAAAITAEELSGVRR